MAGQGRSKGRRGSLPLEGIARTVASLAAIGLLAAVVGYGLGLYLTGALMSASRDPGTPGEGTDAPLVAGEPEPVETGPPPAGPGEDGEPAELEPEDEEPPAEPVTAAPGQQLVPVVPVTLYVVQLGAFNTAENAGAMVQELEQAGIAAAAVNVGGHRVWAGMFIDRPSAQQLAGQLSEAGYEVFVAERHVGADVALTASSPEAAAVLEDALLRLPGYVWEAAALWSGGDTGGGPPLPSDRPLAERVKESLQALEGLPEATVPPALKSAYNRLAKMAQDPAPGAGDPSAAALGEAALLLAEAESVFRQMAAPSGI